MSTIALIAQVVADQPLLYTYGPLGVICAWLMWRDERRSSEIRALAGEIRTGSHRTDGLTKALLVDMTERETCGIHTKRYAREEIAKIDARLPKA